MATQQVGTVAQLWRYPVKSFQGEQVEELELGPGGSTGGSTSGGAPVNLRELSSADEAAYWVGRIQVPDPSAVSGKVVLLVVDATSSLWPITIAASMLRQAGATVVLPLLLHRRP